MSDYDSNQEERPKYVFAPLSEATREGAVISREDIGALAQSLGMSNEELADLFNPGVGIRLKCGTPLDLSVARHFTRVVKNNAPYVRK